MWKNDNDNPQPLNIEPDLNPPDDSMPKNIHLPRIEDCKVCGEWKFKSKPCHHCIFNDNHSDTSAKKR